MGQNTFSRGNKKKAIETEKVELPYLQKVIAKIRTGAYPVARIAFLKGWNYWILETGKFKVKATNGQDADVVEQLMQLPDKEITFYVCVEEEDYYIAWTEKDADWREYDSDKATNYVSDIDTTRIELPSDDDVDDGLPPY